MGPIPHEEVVDGVGCADRIVDLGEDLATEPHTVPRRRTTRVGEVNEHDPTVRVVPEALHESSPLESVDSSAGRGVADRLTPGDLADLERAGGIDQPQGLQIVRLSDVQLTSDLAVGPVDQGLQIGECVGEAIEFWHNASLDAWVDHSHDCYFGD